MGNRRIARRIKQMASRARPDAQPNVDQDKRALYLGLPVINIELDLGIDIQIRMAILSADVLVDASLKTPATWLCRCSKEGGEPTGLREKRRSTPSPTRSQSDSTSNPKTA